MPTSPSPYDALLSCLVNPDKFLDWLQSQGSRKALATRDKEPPYPLWGAFLYDFLREHEALPEDLEFRPSLSLTSSYRIQLGQGGLAITLEPHHWLSQLLNAIRMLDASVKKLTAARTIDMIRPIIQRIEDTER